MGVPHGLRIEMPNWKRLAGLTALLLAGPLQAGQPSHAEPSGGSILVEQLWQTASLSAEPQWPSIDAAQCTVEDQGACLTLLALVDRLRPLEWQQQARSPTPDELRDGPESVSRQLVRVDGRVQRVERVTLEADLAERWLRSSFYRCTLVVDDGPAIAMIAARVPRAWLALEPLDEQANVQALCLSRPRAGGTGREAVLIASRVAWIRETPLGRLGFDESHWDDVRNRTRISAAEQDGFYGLLAAVGRTSRENLLREAGAIAPVAPLFNQPDTQHGRLVQLEGLVRRVTRIEIESPSLREQFGFDHYFQVEMFTADSQNNPVVCCLRTVPSGSENQPRLHETWRVAGYFFKVWAYEPQKSPSATPREPRPALHLAPLVIGPGALRITAAHPEPNRIPLPVAIIVGALAIALAITAWAWRRGDRRAQQQWAKRRAATKLSSAPRASNIDDDTPHP